jgi:hypothetical protein
LCGSGSLGTEARKKKNMVLSAAPQQHFLTPSLLFISFNLKNICKNTFLEQEIFFYL